MRNHHIVDMPELDMSAPVAVAMKAYHNGQGSTRNPKIALEDKRIIIWDGEGADDDSKKRNPQNYVLFGCFTGSDHHRIDAATLSTGQCLEFIIAIGKKYPGAIHMGFGFDYDSNMILKNLSARTFRKLRAKNSVVIDKYRIEHIPGKWLAITEYGRKYKEGDKNDKFTVRIFDIFGFFQTSLVKALKKYVPDDSRMAAYLPTIEAGKDNRGTFRYENLEEIEEYWRVENELLHALAIRLRDMLYDPRVNLRINKWHGPGALASHVYRQNGIQNHKADCGEQVYDASRYAYAGGRFELYRAGRHNQAYGLDINSAYPYGISQLPSLIEGRWDYVQNPRRIVEFGVYKVRMKGWPIARDAAPLFHRDKMGNISFPWRTEGWYWSPEVKTMVQTMPGGGSVVEIIEGWEYTGWETRPFQFVTDLYAQRRRMKDAGIGAEYAIKLALNSLYGKMAQRAGWERKHAAPMWHQLEWAGWVTSYCRAMLYEQIHKIPWDKLIAVETDGIYTTLNPNELGITDSKELGGWEITEFDEMVYLQSGVYAKRQGSNWTSKYRGLDQGSISCEAIINQSKLLGPNMEWSPLVGKTTRFVGYRAALHREDSHRGPFKVHHCVWEKDDKEITSGVSGKRIHSSKLCDACIAGANSYDMPHDLVIRSRSMLDIKSQRHDIPWLDEDSSEWRKQEERV
jgi:DNA polymerase type B, organellar and viral